MNPRTYKYLIHKTMRLTLLFFTLALLLYGCSGSGNSDSVEVINEEAAAEIDDSTSPVPPQETETVSVSSESSAAIETISSETDVTVTETPVAEIVSVSPTASTTQVNFSITVPAFVSNELQVRVQWGELDTTAAWVVDESWALLAELPANTENTLLVTFADRNGSFVLGSFENTFETGTAASQTYQVTADQFDTVRWDSDGDGVSNLEELLAGDNPEIPLENSPEWVEASLEIMPDKTFRISWQSSTGVDFYRVLENLDGESGFSVVAENLESNTGSFDHRVALYRRTNAQYMVQACNTGGCADSEIVAVAGTLESGIGYFKADSVQGGVVNTSYGSPAIFGADHFGSSVKLSADGTTMVMGATGDDSGATGVNGSSDDDSAENSGAVYVFERREGEWQQQAYIKASNTEEGDRFGSNLSLSADGNTLVVGVLEESSAARGIDGDQEDNSALKSGAVYVFVRNDGAWSQQSYIKASNADADDQFGTSLDLSDDGNTLVVGAVFEDGSGRSVNAVKDDERRGSGAAYVFTRSGDTWQERAYLKASNSDRFDNFGNTVRVSGDGNTIAVVAIGEGSRATGINGDQEDNSSSTVGAVYMFVQSGDTWLQEAYVKGSDNRNAYAFGDFSLDLSADGNTMAVGVRSDRNLLVGLESQQINGTVGHSGSVYIFTRSQSGWRQQAFLKASNILFNSNFGGTVSLSGDGNTLAVGSFGETGLSTGVFRGEYNPGVNFESFTFLPFVGAAYLFERSGDDWSQLAYIKASNTEPFDRFADSLDLSGDGNTLAISAGSEASAATGVNGDQEDNSAPGSGAVYLY